MEAKRSRKVTVNLSADTYARLARLAGRRRWKPSFAAAVMVEQGLAASRDTDCGPGTGAHPEAAR